LSFHLLSEKIKIRAHRTIILPAATFGCQNWSLPWQDKAMDVRKLGAEGSVWSKVEKVTGGSIEQHTELHDLYLYQILLGW
jgi:hypothetical protein